MLTECCRRGKVHILVHRMITCPLTLNWMQFDVSSSNRLGIGKSKDMIGGIAWKNQDLQIPSTWPGSSGDKRGNQADFPQISPCQHLSLCISQIFFGNPELPPSQKRGYQCPSEPRYPQLLDRRNQLPEHWLKRAIPRPSLRHFPAPSGSVSTCPR